MMASASRMIRTPLGVPVHLDGPAGQCGGVNAGKVDLLIHGGVITSGRPGGVEVAHGVVRGSGMERKTFSGSYRRLALMSRSTLPP